MTRSHRIITASLIALLLLAGFAIGRFANSPTTNAAQESKAVASDVQRQELSENAGKEQFYLSDFKTGYNDGYQAGVSGQPGTSNIETSRQGYNEGYKEGYTDAYQAQAGNANAEPLARTSVTPVAASAARQRVVYRTVNQPVYRAPVRRGRSKLQTALTIGAPAALGAGIGAMFGGKKGAGIGALLGGGGGAIYELRKHSRRD